MDFLIYYFLIYYSTLGKRDIILVTVTMTVTVTVTMTVTVNLAIL
jgi:hypothetical protein